MILGSHNSMSYLPPKHWWLYPFNFMARCQSKSIKEQYELGVRLFDIRIAYDNTGKPHFRHGLMRYKGTVEPVFVYLNEMGGCHVRIILEEYSDDRTETQENAFFLDCKTWASKYPGIRFCCGTRKWDWKPLAGFADIEGKILHRYASMQGDRLDDLLPWLYAKRHNAKSLAEYDQFNGYLMLDFVGTK